MARIWRSAASGARVALAHAGKSGIDQRSVQRAAHLLDAPSGLILMTGPTGSQARRRRFMAMPDEAQRRGGGRLIRLKIRLNTAWKACGQSQVNPAINLGFAELFRSVLRQSPDVIMLGGDSRSGRRRTRRCGRPTAGTLVMATVHAPTAAGERFRACGRWGSIRIFFRRRCADAEWCRSDWCGRFAPKCKVSFDLSAARPIRLKKAAALAGGRRGAWSFLPRRACEHCEGTGLYGADRPVRSECRVTQALRELISEGHSTADIRAPSGCRGG